MGAYLRRVGRGLIVVKDASRFYSQRARLLYVMYDGSVSGISYQGYSVSLLADLGLFVLGRFDVDVCVVGGL